MIPHSAPMIGEEEVQAVTEVLRSGQLAQGREVEAFEAECAERVGRQHTVAVNSGTSALHLALLALDVKPHDGVAMPSYVCASVLQAALHTKADPRLADIGPDFNLDMATLPDGYAAVIVPHLFGARAQLPEGASVIEDIAQSIGGPTGTEGCIAVASFYATKLMTTGEGGMVFTDDEALAEHVRERRDYDNREDLVKRFNYKMTDMQAALGRAQLRRLSEFIERRREIAARYDDAFSELPLAPPTGVDHVYFRYVVRLSDRDALMKHLHDGGVDAKRPVHKPLHDYFGGMFPKSERAHFEALSLPIYPSLVEDQVDRVIDSVHRFFDS
jgi:perosamine synthetase